MAKIIFSKCLRTRGPDWANFRIWGNCSLWVVLKIPEAAHILGYLFPWLRLKINFDKKTFWATCFYGYGSTLFLTKNVLAEFWAIFLTISSGHPASGDEK
jgi:hypothetical protein